jgi:hypothetical protein
MATGTYSLWVGSDNKILLGNFPPSPFWSDVFQLAQRSFPTEEISYTYTPGDAS